MVDHDIPGMVSVTGSVRAGMEVAAGASKSLKRLHLELGGKAPVIIFDDADLELAAETIAMTGYFNGGQDCTAATRVIAGPKVYNDFVTLLTEQAKKTKTGRPDEDVLYGPLNNECQSTARLILVAHKLAVRVTSLSQRWSPTSCKATR
jgi:betaine-aldehyde dehydrogenase